ncbi:MAG: FAD-dependent oxidoreductase [Emcibacter sp.]|nr:FAD-dependent oxidoreductase [Emcibacter sp.]
MGVEIVIAEAHFIDQQRLKVEEREITARKFVLATGSRPFIPPISGLDTVSYLTNETIFDLSENIEHLIIIGSGAIGCEMAQAFRRFGAEVTLIEMADRLVPIEDPEASAILKAQFEKEGIDMVLGAAVVRVNKKSVTVKEGDQERTLEGDEILVAAGRIPNIEGLDLETAGVDYHRRGVTVNDRLQTSNTKIYAAGDICSPYQFTHSADAMARIVIQNALFFGRKKTSDLVMPWATYTAPEIAHVGMTAKEATEKGDEVVTYSAQMSEIDRAVLEGETAGFAKIYADRRSGRILGATMMSAHAGESISEMALAITARLKMADVAATIHPYPTQAEIWKRLAGEYLKAKFTPSIARIFRVFLKLFAKT